MLKIKAEVKQIILTAAGTADVGQENIFVPNE
jgi:hypothetical protein